MASRLGNVRELGAVVVPHLALLVALLCLGFGWQLAAVIAVLVSAASDYFLERHAVDAAEILDQASFGIPVRFAVRLLIAVLAFDVVNEPSARLSLTVTGLALLSVFCLRSLHTEYHRVGPLKPLRSRNIPGDPFIAHRPTAHPLLSTVAQAVLLAVAFAGQGWPVIALVGLATTALVLAVTIPSMLASWRMRSAKRSTGLTPALRQVQEFLDEHQPEVILHLSGPGDAAYQINTWLPALEGLDRRVLIVIRDMNLFEQMAATTLPTLGLPSASELLMLDFASATVALYPSNTGNNIHLLRLPTLMSAFIGHGDSDKSASANPYSKVYDELWVAGQAGADRYRRSGLGVDEDRYRLVGRPQVDGITTTPRIGDEQVPTILYAPTWEGVNPAQEYSSVRSVGAALVRAILADGRVRLVYKPHPFTGQRDARYRASHAQIVTLIHAARASSGIDHRVVGRGPLTPWFNRATGLISDISSVVSDFLTSEKPYAVFDHENLGTKEFREQFPSSAAATIIGDSAIGIDEFLSVVTGRGPDPLAEYRTKLATYLLGGPQQRSIAAFNTAVDDFIARSERERAAYR